MRSLKAQALACLLAALAVQPASGAGCERREVARVKLRDDAGFLSIPATISGHPVRLMIDTGSDAGLITPEAARGLGLASRLRERSDTPAKVRMHGTGGSGSPVFVARAAEISIGGSLSGELSMPVGELPGAPNLVPKVVGFLGGDFLSQFDLDIDIRNGSLKFFHISMPSRACAPPPVWNTGFVTIPLYAHGVRRSLMVQLDGKPITALLDTGARARVISTQAALQVGVSADQLARDPGGMTSGVDLHVQEYHWHRFDMVSIGGETEYTPLLTVEPLSEPFGMLLGTDWFAAHEVWISYATDRLLFR